MLRTSMVSLSILTVLCTLAHADPILYSGELTSAGDTLIGAGGWSESLVTFHWDVTQNEDLSWHYEYVFDRGSTQGNLSHLLLQTSANFTDADIWNATPALQSENPTWYTPDNGNPNMPGSIYGLKFQPFPESSVSIISFDSARHPCGVTSREGRDQRRSALERRFWQQRGRPYPGPGYTNQHDSGPGRSPSEQPWRRPALLAASTPDALKCLTQIRVQGLRRL